MSYFQSLDSSLGSRVVGPEKTISGKVQDTLTGAQAKAKEVDEQKGFSKTATDVRLTFQPVVFLLINVCTVLLKSPGTSAWPESVRMLAMPPSTKLLMPACHRMAFYTSTTKQVRDIHEEARRIADHHKVTTGEATDTPTESEKTPAAEAEVEKKA